MTPARGHLRFPLPLLLTPSSQFSFKLTSRTAALSTSKYHSFLGPRHMMHSIWKMKGMAGRDTIRLRASDTFEAPSVQFRAIHSVLDFGRSRFHKVDLLPYSFRSGISMLADLTLWVDKGSHMKESNFLLSLPRAPLRRNGDRIFHQLILVTPKPLVGVQSLLQIHCNGDDDWTNEENMTYPSRPKLVMCLNLLGAPAPAP